MVFRNLKENQPFFNHELLKLCSNNAVNMLFFFCLYQLCLLNWDVPGLC